MCVLYNTPTSEKREEIMTYVTTWMNLRDIMLSEINQSQNDKHCMVLLS